MTSFKNKKDGGSGVKLCRALRNLKEMCLYISGGPALVKTLWFGYVVLLESTETFEFCVVSMQIPNARSRYQDIICKLQHSKSKMREKDKWISQFSKMIKPLRLIK